ncbi:MAG: heme ABC exporter ATP-binding protein CcmA [Xanthomonadales bacterium]|nr:heme ABC exporter ATP-binding protein CcmA [Gammaproteobacteria bacterium]NNE05782.1 heme ABC exporter ATP-binding protein CcmA [Xanthomonadales bacterium]NNL96301.1 heme ABC exporter ATP-binding protein CcmA [Xanthomonadales bacterium]
MLSVQDITLERYFKPVFEPVSFELGAGQVMLLTGDNGSGKTTLLRLLAGLLRPSAGSVDLRTRSCMYVGHLLGVKDDLDVIENIEFMGRLFGGAETPLGTILDRSGLRQVASQLARTLSAGQRKRCALSRLLVRRSDLWLLDEPYSNLDQEGIQLMDNMLHTHIEHGGACVLATHGSLRPRGVDFEECKLVPGRVGQ